MAVFETMEAVTSGIDVDDFEQVAFCHHRASGLRAIVAIHSTALGPALGGTRFWPFESEDEALTDVCRLARGMTYKHAAAGLDQGGGKAVIWGDPDTLRSEALIRAYARFVHGLAVLDRARADGIPPGEAADRHAEARIAAVTATRQIRTG